MHLDLAQKILRLLLAIRQPHIWGEAMTACASDSKHFGAWDQNLMTEWHLRYGGKGVMVYWHTDLKSACVYSKLKRSSSSEAAAMIHHLTRKRLGWARLMARVFGIDVLACPRCKSKMQVISFITDPDVIKNILTSLRMPTAPPEPAPSGFRSQSEQTDFQYDYAE